jgi:hypothetical protein
MKNELVDLFHKWHELNTQVEDSFKKFELSSVRELRNSQRSIEDQIYLILLESASEPLKKILPEDCGDLEVGYDITNNKFYFLMEDPTSEFEKDIKIIAFIIDSDKKIEIINDFKQTNDE